MNRRGEIHGEIVEISFVMMLIIGGCLMLYDSIMWAPIRRANEEKERKKAELAQWQAAQERAVPIVEKAEKSEKRFVAEFQGEFSGGFQNHIRQVFVLTDNKTGAKYLAITGCGVSELFEETRTEKHGKQTKHIVETIEE